MSAATRARVAVNLLWLVPGVVGGTETYATGLLRGLAERDAERDVVLVTLPSFAAAHPDLGAAFRTVVAPLPPGRRVVRRVTLESSWLPRRLRELRPRVVHHLGGVVPLGSPGPVALTVHDLQYRHFPAYFSRVKRLYLATMTRRSVRAAAMVMTPSAFTRDDLLAHGLAEGLAPGPGGVDRLRVVPPRLHPPASVRAQDRDRVRDLLGLAGPFVLYPAAPYPHKNHRLLLDAFARVVRRRPDVHLVLPGASGAGAWGSAASTLASLRTFVAENGLEARVHWPGFLPRADLDALLAEAQVLAFPSRFEGYGLPVVEAMLAGTPVLAADATALPEVLGRGESAGGRLLPPDDVAAWAGALEKVLTDPAEVSRLSAAGRARAAVLRATDPVDALLEAWDLAAATERAEAS